MSPKQKAEELMAQFRAIQLGETEDGKPYYLGTDNDKEVKSCVYITISEIRKQADNWGVKSVNRYWQEVLDAVRWL